MKCLKGLGLRQKASLLLNLNTRTGGKCTGHSTVILYKYPEMLFRAWESHFATFRFTTVALVCLT